MIISLDTETTGLDLFHGAKPFFVTVAHLDDDNEVRRVQWWEWPVDPVSRQPLIPPADLDEIRALLDSCTELVGQNCKFDCPALRTVGVANWPWEKTHDTLMAGHLLASNQPHDLTSMVSQYLGGDIQPFEDRLREATIEARRIAKTKFHGGGITLFSDEEPGWRTAKKGEQDMPSTKDKAWKQDAWLPRAVAIACKYPADHPWYSVLREYANADSVTTLKLWVRMRAELKRQGLWLHYRERMKSLSVLVEMERGGVTYNQNELVKLRAGCIVESERLGARCVEIAAARGYALSLPKSGRNKSLNDFVFEVLGLEQITDPKGKSAGPMLDGKIAIPKYLDTLPHDSDAYEFIKTLAEKRAKDPAIAYLDGYERYGLPLDGFDGWMLLHPSFHPAGTKLMRRSSSNPNGQNIGKKSESNMRKCFGPAPGREWWSLDAKNLELRIPAYESGEQELIDLFERCNEPPYYGSEHLLNFSTVYPDIWEDAISKVGFEKAGPYCKKEYEDSWYQWCKNGDFAVGYGAIDRADGQGTADRAFRRPGSQARLATRFARKEQLNQKWIRFAEKHGYVETIPDRSLGMTRGYPLMVSRNQWSRIRPTEPLNYHIQGCLAGASRVLTTDGLIPIRELVGKCVRVWTGFVWASAIGLDRGTHRRATIKLNSGLTIECDTRHKLKNELDQWVDFADLKVGDYVSLPTNPDPMDASKGVNWWFILGFIIGDGCLMRRGNRRTLSICGGTLKKKILEEIRAFLTAEGYRAGWRVWPAKGNKKEKYAVVIESKQFADFLESYGVSYDWKSKTKRVPQSVWTAVRQNRRDFLEGLWLSDGTRAVTSGAGRGLNMTNSELLREVQILASDLGFDSHFEGPQLRFRWRAFNVKSSRKYPASAMLHRIAAIAPRMLYSDPCQHTTDARAIAVAHRGVDLSQYVAERILRLNAPSALAYRYDRIVSIRVHNIEETTYTMSVDDPLHQFVADGVIHKNTAGWWMLKALIRVSDQLKEWNKNAPDQYRLTLEVHDELVFDFPAGRGAEPWKTNLPKIRKIQSLMEMGGDDIGVPTPVDVEYNPLNWAEGKKF